METNDWFFYQDKGKTVGPVTETDLRDRIRDGRIRLFDLIHKEGESGWRMAMEFPLLKEEFKGGARLAIQERPWVCLQRRSSEGLEFMTTGPFSQEEIRENLLAGRMSYTDYGWKTGFTEWKRLGALEEFNPRMKPQAPPPADFDEHTLLKNVVELRRARPESSEPPPPPESDGRDLLDLKSAPPPPIPEEKATEPTPAQEPSSSQAEKAKSKSKSRSKRRRRRKSVPWVDWGIVVALIVILISAAFILSRAFRKSAPSAMMRESTQNVVVQAVAPPAPPVKPEPPSPPPAELTPPPEPVPVVDSKPFKPDDEVEAAAPQPTPTPEKPIVKKPSELKLNVQTLAGNQVRIEVRTNGSADFPVYVQVVGLPGQVSEGGAFYRYMRVKTTGSPTQPLDLSSLKLPLGKFILRAATGDLHKEAHFHLGLGDAAFKQNVNHLRKMYAHSFWSERLHLIRLVQTLEKRTADAVAGKKFSSKGLEALRAVKRSNGQNYLLFEDWYELKDIFDDAKSQPSTAVLGRIKKMKEHLASFSIYK